MSMIVNNTGNVRHILMTSQLLHLMVSAIYVHILEQLLLLLAVLLSNSLVALAISPLR